MKKFTLCLVLPLLVLNVFAQKSAWLDKKVDFENLSMKKDSFNMMKQDKVVGYWIWESIKNDENVIFKDLSILYNTINEQIEMHYNIDKGNVTSVQMKMWNDDFILKADVSRENIYALSGKFKIEAKENREKTIDTIYRNKVVLRPLIFGILPYLENTYLNEKIDTFFLSSATNSVMELKYIGEDTVTVPAGTFETEKISFTGENQVSNIIYLTKQHPKKIVKVEVIGQELVMELVNNK